MVVKAAAPSLSRWYRCLDRNSLTEPTLGLQHILDSSNDPSPTETDTGVIGQPLSTHVHKNLKQAWQISQEHPMCFIFDPVSPAHLFKWGTPFSDGKE